MTQINNKSCEVLLKNVLPVHIQHKKVLKVKTANFLDCGCKFKHLKKRH